MNKENIQMHQSSDTKFRQIFR